MFVVGPADNREETLRFLQEIGAVHLEPAQAMAGEAEKRSAALLARVRKLGQVIHAVQRFGDDGPPVPLAVADDALSDYAEAKLSELQETESRRAALARLRGELLPWGDFSLAGIRALEEAGLFVRRYRMEARKWEAFAPPADLFLQVVAEQQGVLFYTLSLGGPPEIPQASLLPWPEMGLREAEAELRRLAEKAGHLKAELAAVAARLDLLKGQLVAARNAAIYAGHMATLYEEPHLFGLQGWIPADQEAAFRRQVEACPFPLRVEMREPLADEQPPVLLKNNWFTRRIEPLLKLYGVPHYRELDPSTFFAPFMILFFGICLGDAGYGLIFLLLSLWIEKKLGPRIEGLPLVMKLCEAFAIATIVVGLVTGSVFGYNFEHREWILIDVAVGVGDPMILFYGALGLGVLQLSISYVLGAVQAAGWGAKLAKLGLLGVLWGGTLLISKNIWFADPASPLNLPFHYGGSGALALGLLLTLLFASDHRNWGVRIGLGLWNIYGLTGLVGDLLSYARLFGLGIATGAIAAVMNQLAGMAVAAAGPVVGTAIGILVIILGHTFNLLLGILGSTVHSARLHFVEAFKSFFEGGGTDYKPFRIERG